MKRTPNSRKYDSAQMQERRERIAEAARRLIVEKGASGFSMAELSRLAGVSEKTLYNVVGNRNTLIAQAVERYQQQLAQQVSLPPGHGLEEILASLAAICGRLVAEKGWGKAIAELYFSPETDAATYGFLQTVARTHIGPALRLFARQGHVAPDAPADLVTHHFANTAYSLIHDWALGRLDDDAFPRHVGFALLAALSSIVEEPARRRLSGFVRQLLAEIDKPGFPAVPTSEAAGSR